jgi:hypothetical protein
MEAFWNHKDCGAWTSHTAVTGGACVIRLLHQFRLINFIKEAYFFIFKKIS